MTTRTWKNFLALVAAGAILISAGAAVADDAKPAAGSIARQLLLKRRLEKIAAGTLSASLEHNRRQWDQLSPEQRDQMRRTALAFENANPAEQKRLLERYEQLSRLTPQKQQAYRERAKWLEVVVASFTPQERAQLRDLPADQRAKMLLDRKAQLIREGKLKAEAPATQPATRPVNP
ncbi:MAG: DUF3106 domain-containing protein [Planctomycetaceae bacterium]|nr:DUF3106 domain-containing protein [Planctomycetaceae bacterium]